jgi:hypothetical protein
MVTKRTEIGSALIAQRHNELHALVEHVGEAAPEFVWWEAKRRTKSLSPLPWPQIDSRLLKLVPDIHQLTLFRAFVFGPLARWLPKGRQYEVAKACLDWHKEHGRHDQEVDRGWRATGLTPNSTSLMKMRERMNGQPRGPAALIRGCFRSRRGIRWRAPRCHN